MSLTSTPSPILPVEHTDPVNARILAVSEDLVEGFQRHPFHIIAEKSGVPLADVLARIRAMLEAGVIRRVRQTLSPPGSARGALCAWKVDNHRLDQVFDFMFQEDPFSGHVVTRSTDRAISGSDYRLWTTLKVPLGDSLDEHATALKRLVGADNILMPAKGIFALGVGHVRRKSMEPGDKVDEPAKMIPIDEISLNLRKNRDVLLALKSD